MNIFSFHGRIGRMRYFLGLLITSVIVSVVDSILGFLLFFLSMQSLYASMRDHTNLANPVNQNASLILLLILLSVIIGLISLFITTSFIVRRLHDIGKSGKWWFALLIPIYNIHLSIGLLTERGAIGPNQYGDDPLPPNTPDDNINRFGQNKVARVIVDIIIVGLIVVCFGIGILIKIKQQKIQQQQMGIPSQQSMGLTTQGYNVSTSSLPVANTNQTQKWTQYSYTAMASDNFNSFSFNYPTQYPDDIGGLTGINVIRYASQSEITDSTGRLMIDVLITPLAGRLMAGVNKWNVTGSIGNFQTTSGLHGQMVTFDPDITGGGSGYTPSGINAYRIVIPLPQKNPNAPQMALEFDLHNSIDKPLVDAIAKTVQLNLK